MLKRLKRALGIAPAAEQDEQWDRAKRSATEADSLRRLKNLTRTPPIHDAEDFKFDDPTPPINPMQQETRARLEMFAAEERQERRASNVGDIAADETQTHLLVQEFHELSNIEKRLAILCVRRLAMGQRLYGPFSDGEDMSRDFHKEAIEEAIDGFVYSARMAMMASNKGG